jgi:hypothetical protein
MTSRRPAIPGLALLLMLAGLSAHAAPQISVQLGNTDGVWTAAVSRDGKLALSGDKSKAYVLWDVATGRQIRAFPGAAGVLYAVAFSPDGKTVLRDSAEPSVCTRESPSAWARLLAKVYEVDALHCGRCGSPLKVLAVITDPQKCQRILLHLIKTGVAPPGVEASLPN